MSGRSSKKRNPSLPDDPKKKANNNKTKAKKDKVVVAPERRRRQVGKPPASLIRLLQKDSAVVRYFESLQTNLVADVAVQKDRAAAYKTQCQALERQVTRLQQEAERNEASSRNHHHKTATPQEARASKKRARTEDEAALVTASTRPLGKNEAARGETKDEEEQLKRDDDEADDWDLFSDDDNDDEKDEDENPSAGNSELSGGKGSNPPLDLPDIESCSEEEEDHEEEEEDDHDEEGMEEKATTTASQSAKVAPVTSKRSKRPKEDASSSFLFDLESTTNESTRHARSKAAPKAATTKKGRHEDKTFQFSLESSSEDDDDDDDHDNEMTSVDDKESSALTTPPRPSSKDQAETFDLLQQVYRSWTQMGVRFLACDPSTTQQQQESLPLAKESNAAAAVAPNVVATTTTTTTTVPATKETGTSFGGLDTLATTWHTEDVSSEDEERTEAVLVRASDEDVVADLLHVLKNAVRPETTQDQGDTSMAALLFTTEGFVPCCNPPNTMSDTGVTQHPAVQIKRTILRGLVILDTLCAESVSDYKWKGYFSFGVQQPQKEDAALAAAMKVGLRGRKAMVVDFVRSLEQEICEVWPCADRLDYHTTTALPLETTIAAAAVDEKEAVAATTTTTMRKQLATLSKGAKSQPRLSILLDRCIMAQLVIGFYLAATDQHRPAQLVLDYILATAPCKGVEDYPRLPPTLSLVVLEALLFPEAGMLWWMDHTQGDEARSWFDEYCLDIVPHAPLRFSLLHQLQRAVQTTVSVWEQRVGGADSRIHDLALVELASYKRLQSTSLFAAMDDMESQSDVLSLWTSQNAEKLDRRTWTLVMSMMIVMEDRDKLHLQMQQACHDACGGKANVNVLCLQILAASEASRQLELRLLPTALQQVGRSHEVKHTFPSFSDAFQALFGANPCYDSDQLCQVLSTSLQCSRYHADAETAFRTMQVLVEKQETLDSASKVNIKQLFDAVTAGSQVPVIRVINLQQRHDRYNAFMARALREHVLVVKAVAAVTPSAEDESRRHQDFGRYAIDGSGRLAEAHERLIGEFGSTGQLEKLVDTQWCPNNLRPFDRDAPKHQKFVRMTPSEQACALSHICSWKGVLRSLRLPPSQPSPSRLLRFPNHLVRLSKISGFAEGPAFLPKNHNMPPSPVCVILEDDSILVDRFVERLQAVLKELPRDFHFCSLGYSRPKTAPICPFSELLGIPTMQWYLTGYIISEAGASYLLDALPVKGPVDSWVGLKMMTDNWDNSFGTNLGVGVSHVTARGLIPSLKELRQIVHFRTFCALQPLCSQRVAGTAVASARSWRRQRDTDIDYSGGTATATIKI